MSDKKTAVIIGAGVGGLALANILAKAGFDVTIYEKNKTPGGRMGKFEKQGFTFDTGPSWYLMKDVFNEYFNLFDKSTEDYFELTRLDPSYKVFYEKHRPITIKGSYKENLKTFEALEVGSGKKLDKYISKGQKNYYAALNSFLYNPFNKPSNYLNKKIFTSSPQFVNLFASSLHSYVSKNFKSLELQQILEYPSVFLGASPYNTPALYQLMSYLDFKEGVFYPKKRGMYVVAESLVALGKELGVKYKYQQNVSKIVVTDGHAIGLIVDDRFISADIVISNADLKFTETKLLKVKHQTYPESYWKKRDAGPSALLLYLGVKGALPELEHHNLFFVKDWQKNFDQIYKFKEWPERASVYVSKTSATDRTTAPKGHENVFVLVPLPPGKSKSKQDINKFVDIYLEQIEQMSGISDLRERVVVKEVRSPDYFGETFNAWDNTALGMSHTLRQTAFLRPSVKSKKVNNLFFVGAGSQPGIGVPMCLISAQIVYKYLAKDWSVGAPKNIVRVDL